MPHTTSSFVALFSAPADLSTADTAWILVSAALVLLMTPALAFFYGGMVRSKNALNTMMMSFCSLGVVGCVWAFAGYSLAFSEGSAWIGGLDHLFLKGVGFEPRDGQTIPHLLFCIFQGTFAIITAAIISGALVERMRFSAYLFFIALWTLFVYAPVCHWVWGPGGWLEAMGALDYAGGTVVHVNAGAAAVVGALLIGSRKDYGRQALLPHNVPYILLGTGLLWFGWFGFNAGSALAADESASLAFANTFLAPCAAMVTWLLLDHIRISKMTAVGAATGTVVGLVAITPAAAFVGPMDAIAIGMIATFPSYLAIQYRSRSRLDDSLDVAAAHGVGGLTGAMLVGVFAREAWGGTAGLFEGNAAQVAIQGTAVLAALAFSALASFALFKLVSLVIPLRVELEEEGRGLDVPLHGEQAISSGEGAVLLTRTKRPPKESATTQAGDPAGTSA